MGLGHISKKHWGKKVVFIKQLSKLRTRHMMSKFYYPYFIKSRPIPRQNKRAELVSTSITMRSLFLCSSEYACTIKVGIVVVTVDSGPNAVPSVSESETISFSVMVAVKPRSVLESKEKVDARVEEEFLTMTFPIPSTSSLIPDSTLHIMITPFS